MKLHSHHLVSTCLISLLGGVAHAQGVNSSAQAEDTIVREADILPNEIVVSGERLRGQLDVEQAPVLELNEEDIQAVGATSVADLIAAIGPQTGSSRGRGGGQPVFLVNG
ncbi:MAG: hypothetical protein EP341_07295, partial [Sphingomonadales bacterium]